MSYWQIGCTVVTTFYSIPALPILFYGNIIGIYIYPILLDKIVCFGMIECFILNLQRRQLLNISQSLDSHKCFIPFTFESTTIHFATFHTQLYSRTLTIRLLVRHVKVLPRKTRLSNFAVAQPMFFFIVKCLQ